MFQDYDFQGYLDAYSFIEFSSGQSIINILKTERIMRMVYDRLFEKYDISEPKFFVILLLSTHNEDSMPLIELGRNMMVSRANMTTLIDRMIKEKLVEKHKNIDDKRSIKAHLTPKGKELFDEIKELHMEFSERMTKVLTEDEKLILNNLLKKLQADIVSDFSTNN